MTFHIENEKGEMELVQKGEKEELEFPKLPETPTSLDNVDFLRLINPLRFLGYQFEINVRIPGTDAATAANYLALFFIARRSYEIISCRERHETLGSDGSAVTVMLNKVPDGTAPASGTSVLTSGIDLKATINTLQTGTITSTIANKRLVAGDGLCLETTGTLTAVAGVTMVVELKAL